MFAFSKACWLALAWAKFTVQRDHWPCSLSQWLHGRDSAVAWCMFSSVALLLCSTTGMVVPETIAILCPMGAVAVYLLTAVASQPFTGVVPFPGTTSCAAWLSCWLLQSVLGEQLPTPCWWRPKLLSAQFEFHPRRVTQVCSSCYIHRKMILWTPLCTILYNMYMYYHFLVRYILALCLALCIIWFSPFLTDVISTGSFYYSCLASYYRVPVYIYRV